MDAAVNALSDEEHDCYCRILPLKSVATEDEIEMINSVAYRVSEITRHTYQLIKMFYVSELENEEKVPLIDESIVRMIFSLVSNRGTKPPENYLIQHELEEFYKSTYSPLMVNAKEDGSGINDILHATATQITTNIDNHIKGYFYSYVKKLAKCYLYHEREKYSSKLKLLISDLFNETFESEQYLHDMIRRFSPRIKHVKCIYQSKPQITIPLLYAINREIETQAKSIRESIQGQETPFRAIPKPFCLLPLKRSLIPDAIPISKTISGTTFGGFEFWDSLQARLLMEFNPKPGFEITSVKTNGISLSVTFQQGKRRKGRKKQPLPESYIEDISDEQAKELMKFKVVAVDPNKGNLGYFNDGERTLRYTQNCRRKMSGRIKYRKYRLLNERNARAAEMDDLDLQENFQLLSQYSGNSMTLAELSEYVFQKNLYADRFISHYQQSFYRKFKFNSKINTKRSDDLFLKRFRATYGPPSQTILAFGDWEQRQGISFGKEPTLGKGLRSLFRKRGYHVFLVDERSTSITCCKCHSENEYNFMERHDPKSEDPKDKQKVWGLSRCTNVSCRAIHNRDHNASSNILSIALNYIDPWNNALPDPLHHSGSCSSEA